MRHCNTCGHHHGQQLDNYTMWPSCGGYVYELEGGVRRCCCAGPHEGE